MSNNKKDLTRIEDLGEYVHELNTEGEDSSFESSDFLSPEDPSLDEGQGESLFSSNDSPTSTLDLDSTGFITNDINFENSETVEEDNSFSLSTLEESTPPTEIFETHEDPFLDSEDLILDEAPDSFEESVAPPKAQQLQDESSFEPLPQTVQTAPSASEVKLETFKAPENFEDLKRFAESTSLTGQGAEANPSFSVMIKNVRFIEDAQDILSLLKDLGLMSDTEEQIKNRLMRGHLLVPRISEYAAVLLAHKLRRFDIDILVGLSDEIHPPKHQEKPETGLVSKFNLYQNQTHSFQFDNHKVELSQVQVATTPSLEGHQIMRYLGLASEHKVLDGNVVEAEDSEGIPIHYHELAQKLKAHALKAGANAVVGVNYQLTPLPKDIGPSGSKYRLSCTGNLVWVNKL